MYYVILGYSSCLYLENLEVKGNISGRQQLFDCLQQQPFDCLQQQPFDCLPVYWPTSCQAVNLSLFARKACIRWVVVDVVWIAIPDIV